MHQSFVLLEEAMALVSPEEAALAAEDLDQAESLSGKRAALLQEAWINRNGCDEEALSAKLKVHLEAQQRLSKLAAVVQSSLRARNQAAKKQGNYFSSERHLHGAARKSVYFDVQS